MFYRQPADFLEDVVVEWLHTHPTTKNALFSKRGSPPPKCFYATGWLDVERVIDKCKEVGLLHGKTENFYFRLFCIEIFFIKFSSYEVANDPSFESLPSLTSLQLP